MSRFPEGFEPDRSLYLGAEAEIWLGTWMDLLVVAKIRRSKGYRLEQLNQRLIGSRTAKEANLMHEAKLAGIPTPVIYHVNPVTGVIIMSFVEGVPLKEILSAERESIVQKAGTMVSRLHKASISHGDLTPSNILVQEENMIFLDFGLGEKTSETEKLAEDLNVMKLALDSMFGELGKSHWQRFVHGYVEGGGDQSRSVLRRLEEIGARGRYRRRDVHE